jgi:hypothetical protein
MIGDLEIYLKNNSDFLAESLKEKMTQIHNQGELQGLAGDNLFWYIVGESSPRAETDIKQPPLS